MPPPHSHLPVYDCVCYFQPVQTECCAHHQESVNLSASHHHFPTGAVHWHPVPRWIAVFFKVCRCAMHLCLPAFPLTWFPGPPICLPSDNPWQSAYCTSAGFPLQNPSQPPCHHPSLWFFTWPVCQASHPALQGNPQVFRLFNFACVYGVCLMFPTSKEKIHFEEISRKIAKVQNQEAK